MIQGRVDRKEGGGGEGETGSGATGRGKMGRGAKGRERQGWGKRGGVEVLARVGSGKGETWRVRPRRGQWGGGGGQWEGEMGGW